MNIFYPWYTKGSLAAVFTHPKDLLAGGKDLSLLTVIRHEPSPSPPPFFSPFSPTNFFLAPFLLLHYLLPSSMVTSADLLCFFVLSFFLHH